MHVEEIQISGEDKSSSPIGVRVKAIGISTGVGAGIGAAYAYFHNEKYWKAMLIGGACFAVVSGILILRK